MNEFPFYVEPSHLKGPMTDTSGNAARDVATAGSEGRVIVDMRDRIALLEPTQSPLTSLLTNVGKTWDGSVWKGPSMLKAVTTQPEFA